MTKLVNHCSKDDAVSPVVGVMLMIVVTVVIAAVVALFATSVATSTEAAPVVVIDMNASVGTPAEINNKLVMSTRGGDPLDLTKLKVVATINDGDDGNVYKGLEKDPLVGQFLEIGEKLTIFGGESYCVLDTTSQIGEGFDPVEDLVVGDKLKVSVIFNDNAIIYEKELIIKDGAHQKEVAIPTTGNETVDWKDESGNSVTSVVIDWDTSTISAKTINSGNGVEVTIADSTATVKGSSSTAKKLFVYPKTSGEEITGIKANTTAVNIDGTAITVSGSFNLTATAGSVTKYTVTLYEVDGADWETGTAISVNSGSTIGLFQTSGSPNVYELKVNDTVVDTLTIEKTTKTLGGASFASESSLIGVSILNTTTTVESNSAVSAWISNQTVTLNNKNGGSGEKAINWEDGESFNVPYNSVISYSVTNEGKINVQFGGSMLATNVTGSLVDTGKTIGKITSVTFGGSAVSSGTTTVTDNGELIVAFTTT